jgi:hypothetical protein
MNSQEVAACLDPHRGGKDVASGRRAGAGGSSPAVGEQTRRHRACQLEAARGALVRASGTGTEGDTE